MLRLDRITTRTGDKGQTRLADGTPLPKHHPLIAALGELDEANAVLGLCRTQAGLSADIAAAIEQVQHDLFELGAELAAPAPAPRVDEAAVQRLEGWIAAGTARLAPLDSFVLPGGTPAAAWLHLARTVVRRAERALAAAQAALPERPWNPCLLPYLNRLSDACFVWARLANDGGRADVLWRPARRPPG